MKKSAIITGSSGLIGSEMTREFLSKGYQVYGLDLKENLQIKDKSFKFFKCDISKESDIIMVFKEISNLNVLINNGAVANPDNGPLEKLSLVQWNKIISTNLTSLFLMTKSSLPFLKKSKGSIVNISSIRQRMVEPHNEIYSASKGGVEAFTRALAISNGPLVRVNSISPGWIADPKKKLRKVDHKQHPVGRVGRPSDISKLALYLSSKDASFITGQNFIVDGGMVIKMIYQD